MTRDWLLPLLGYDARLAYQLSFDAQGQLRSVCAGWLVVLVLLAWPLGYVFWLTEHSVVLATFAAIAVYALCLNLLRVAVAGGGAGLTFAVERVKRWKPGLVPPVFLLVMGCLLAQPAQLLFTHHEHTVAVEARRAELSAKKAALRTLVDTPTSGASAMTPAFDNSLSKCEFVVYRIQLLWSNPSGAARFTALYALLILIPVFWSRFVALEALRAYESERYRQVLSCALSERTGAARAVVEALSAWPTYVAPNASGAEGTASDADIEAKTLIRRALAAPRRVPRSQPILRWRTWP